MPFQTSKNKSGRSSFPFARTAASAALSALAALTLGGCAAHKAQHFDAPDAATLRGKRDEAANLVTSARTKASDAAEQFTAASPKLREATDSRAKETEIVAQLAPKLADLRMRVTVELRPEVDAAIAQLDDLKSQSAITGAALDEGWKRIEAGRTELASSVTDLQGAHTVLDEISGKYGPEYEKAVAALTEKANLAEQGWHDASAQVVALRSESLMHRILGIAGALGVLAIAILYFTGRIGKAAATVATEVAKL